MRCIGDSDVFLHMLYAARRHMVSMQMTHTVNTRARIRFRLSICLPPNSTTEETRAEFPSLARPESPASDVITALNFGLLRGPEPKRFMLEPVTAAVLRSMVSTDCRRRRQMTSKKPYSNTVVVSAKVSEKD